jgi:hypothetical protein
MFYGGLLRFTYVLWWFIAGKISWSTNSEPLGVYGRLS